MPWFGELENIPNGFKYCDGTIGTPDLRGKFLKGTDTTTNQIGIAGGNQFITLKTINLPSGALSTLKNTTFYSTAGINKGKLHARDGGMTNYKPIYQRNIGDIITTGWNSIPIDITPSNVSVHYIMKI